jgi:hypothetical protein
VRKLDRRWVRRRVVAVEAQLPELGGSGSGYLLAVRVADLGAEERAQAVDVPTARGVEYVDPLSTLEHGERCGIGAEGSVGSEVEQQVIVRELRQTIVLRTYDHTAILE